MLEKFKFWQKTSPKFLQTNESKLYFFWPEPDESSLHAEATDEIKSFLKHKISDLYKKHNSYAGIVKYLASPEGEEIIIGLLTEIGKNHYEDFKLIADVDYFKPYLAKALEKNNAPLFNFNAPLQRLNNFALSTYNYFIGNSGKKADIEQNFVNTQTAPQKAFEFFSSGIKIFNNFVVLCTLLAGSVVRNVVNLLSPSAMVALVATPIIFNLANSYIVEPRLNNYLVDHLTASFVKGCVEWGKQHKEEISDRKSAHNARLQAASVGTNQETNETTNLKKENNPDLKAVPVEISPATQGTSIYGVVKFRTQQTNTSRAIG